MCSPLSFFCALVESQLRELFVDDLRDCHGSLARELFSPDFPEQQFEVFIEQPRHPCLVASALHVYTVYAVYGGVSMVIGAGQGYAGGGPVNGTGNGAGAGAMLVTAGAGAGAAAGWTH